MIADKIRAAISGVGVGAGIQRGRGVLSTLTDAQDLGTKGSIVCSKDVWTCIGSYQILPQTRQEPGFGTEGELGRNIGLLYLAIRDETLSQVHGKIRVAVTDNQDRIKGYYIHSVRTEKLDDSASDRTQAFIAPARGGACIGGPYDYIKIYFNPDTTDTISGNENADTATEIRLDTTLYA